MSVETRIRIVSVDDHPLMREGIAAIIANEGDMLMVAQASNGQEAIEQFQQHQPDVTLMDLRMPGMSGVEAIEAIRAESPEARIVVLTTFDGDVEIQRALAAGAWGYVLKSAAPNELLEVIRRVRGGKKQIPTELAGRLAEHVSDQPLTDRERTVLQHVADGDRNRDIAGRLFISEQTVKVHLKHIMEKLGATYRTQVVAIAVRRGIVQL